MIDNNLHVTVEEAERSYIFKVIKKVLSKTFPWFIDAYVDSDDINRYKTIFLILEINPFIMMEEYGWSILENVRYYNIESGRAREIPTLDFIFDISPEEATQFQYKIREVIWSVSNSKVIPDELKVKDGERGWSICGYVVPPISE